jgi:hypothetical protein
MTPAERTAQWREAHPMTYDESAQRQMAEAWLSGAKPCPWVIDHGTWRISSRRNGSSQKQYMHKGVRFQRSVITWCLLHGSYIPASRLQFRLSTQTLEVLSDLE